MENKSIDHEEYILTDIDTSLIEKPPKRKIKTMENILKLHKNQQRRIFGSKRKGKKFLNKFNVKLETNVIDKSNPFQIFNHGYDKQLQRLPKKYRNQPNQEMRYRHLSKLIECLNVYQLSPYEIVLLGGALGHKQISYHRRNYARRSNTGVAPISLA